jgi:hypothetical protein
LSSDEPVVIAVDSTGIKVTNRGEWMREKWRIYRGWIKVHLAVDMKTKQIVCHRGHWWASIGWQQNQLDLSSSWGKYLWLQNKGSFGRMEHLIEEIDIDRLQEKVIQSIIKSRSNASTKSRGSPARANAVREMKSLGYQNWKQKYSYGRQWAAETVFSAVKRISGEHVAATKKENMMQKVT